VPWRKVNPHDCNKAKEGKVPLPTVLLVISGIKTNKKKIAGFMVSNNLLVPGTAKS
jgi:hypothetical protein